MHDTTYIILKRSITGLSSEFSFPKNVYHTKAKEHRLPYYLSMENWIIVGFIPFPGVLQLCVMQTS